MTKYSSTTTTPDGDTVTVTAADGTINPQNYEDDTEGEIQVAFLWESREDEASIQGALQWGNREDFRTRGKLKSVGAAVASAAMSKVVEPLGGAIAALRLAKTLSVIGALQALRTGGLSKEAWDDVDYILRKK